MVFWGFFLVIFLLLQFAARLLSSLASGSVCWDVGVALYSEQLWQGTAPSVCAPFTRVNEAEVFQL